MATYSASLNIDIELTVDLPKVAPVQTPLVFTPTIHSVKSFGIAIGDLDLSARVTSVTAFVDANGSTVRAVVSGFDLIQAISDRSNESIRIYLAYRHNQTGEVQFSQDLLTVDFEQVDSSAGGRSQSLTLSGRGAAPASSANSFSADEVEFFSTKQVRLPVDFGVAVGDTVNYAYGSIQVAQIAYSIGPTNKSMTLTAV